jgi:hypothetical protein
MSASPDFKNATKRINIAIDIDNVGHIAVTPAQKAYFRSSDEGAMHGAISALKQILEKSNNGVIPGSYDGTHIHLTNANIIWLGGEKYRQVKIDDVLAYLDARQNASIDLGLFGILPAGENAKIYAALLTREKLRQRIPPAATAPETPEATND